MNRGDRREPIFDDGLDRQRFLQTLAEACARTDWQVHAWCLMGNHFHLVIETPQPNLVVGMKWFLGRRVLLPGIASADRRPSGRAPLRGGTAGERRRKSSAAGRRGAEESALDGGGFEAAPQVRPSEDRAGGAVATGNDDDAQMDCRTLADGSLDALEQTVV